jgi:hypothetical protein
MKLSEFFFKVGGTAWLLFAGAAVLIFLLHWLGAVNATRMDWRLYGIMFGAGGLAAMILGGVCAIWDQN